MIQEHINEILGNIEIQYINETFSTYEIEFPHPDINILSEKLNLNNYNSINDLLVKYGYKWDLSIDDLSYSINQEEFNSLTIEDYDDVENISVRFNIYKTKNYIHIINNESFNDYLKSINLQNLLDVVNTFDSEFILKNKPDDFEICVNKDEKLNISNQCYFRNLVSFPYSPDTFYFNNIDKGTKSILDDYFLKLSQVFCYIYIFNSSEIEGDNLYLTISGNLTYNYTLDFKQLDVSSLKFYHQIYKWIYSEKTKIEDKIGLSRNIITSYLKDDSLIIDNSVFNSILSSNQIYIKGNISKYFEVRNKIIEQIEQTISKVNQSLDTFFNNFQKSVFVFISFFLTVFIYKIANKSSLNNIFTKETSLIGIGFILLSILFLIASYIIYRLDKKRVCERYENVKTRYSDVLIKDDIGKIINGDFEYNNEIFYLEKRINIYIILWVLTIIVFIVVLFLSSEYLDTNQIFDFLKNPTLNK